MGGMLEILAVLFAVIVAIALAVLVIRYLLAPVFQVLGLIIRNIVRFVAHTLRDVFRLIGSLVTTLVYVPLVVVTVLIGRWSASRHFGAGIQQELSLAGASVYRLFVGNIARLFGAGDVVAGIEERVPQALAEAPGRDAPRGGKAGAYAGYTIVGSLAGGGSGGKLYIAEPDAVKMASFERNGHFGVDQVVIKSFSMREGSSLPQIVRESRSLDAAKRLGLVLDHDLTAERFFYVMRYVPGQSLTAVTHQLHAGSSPADGSRGLDDASLRRALGLASDLVSQLEAYHRGGLWHKDVKPDNIIVDGARAHLVDFGLVTPLRSAMTLTTHGTEYFRDPEMVRMALKGVKVHEVDGARFDIYGAGAVLYSIIENSFPAHGVLSQITQRCPEALRWVVRRAMTDYDKRYRSAGEMLRDIESIRLAADPMAVKPAQLPSMREGAADVEPSVRVDPEIGQVAAAGGFATGVGGGVGQGNAAQGAAAPAAEGWSQVVADAQRAAERAVRLASESLRGAAAAVGAAGAAAGAAGAVRPGEGAAMGAGRPRVRVVNWWTGQWESDAPGASVGPADASPASPREEFVRRSPEGPRAAAHEQVSRARSRAQAARGRALERMAKRRSINRSFSANPNGGVYFGLGLGLAVLFASSMVVMTVRETTSEPMVVGDGGPRFILPENAGGVATNGMPTPQISGDPVTSVSTREEARADGLRALVVVAMQKPLSAEHESMIRRVVDSLSSRGFEVRGDVPGREASDQEILQTAGALNALSGLSVDTPAGAAAVSRWIGITKASEIVVWVKPKPGAGTEATGSVPVGVEFFVIQPELAGLDADVRERARQAALAANQAVARR
jgi:hypothetical protein